MTNQSIIDLIDKPISGEWGKDPVEEPIIKVIRNTNFTNTGKLDLSNVVERCIPHQKIIRKSLRNGDIIIEKSGGSPNQPVGRVVYYDQNDGDYLFSNFTSALRPRKEVFPRYLFYMMFAHHSYNTTLAFQNKTTGIINLQLARYLEKTKIPLPPLETQKRITAILDKADELRCNEQKILEKYDQLAQSVFLEMFGDPVTNPKGWEKGPTINYCDCIVPGRNKPKSFTGDIPWVTTEDLVYRGTTLDSKKKICLSIEESREAGAKVIPAMSVIMTCVGDLGIVSINQKEMVVNQQLHTFQCKSSILPLFLMYNLSFQTPYMHKMASNTTVPYLNKTMCNNTPTILPPIVLQKRFAEIIIHIETQKQLTQQSLQKSEELFQSLLQRAFREELFL